MNYEEQIRDEVEREVELYASMIDMLQNGDVSIDFENEFSKDRIRSLNAYLVNHTMDVVYGQCTDKLFKQAEKEMNEE